MQSTIGAMFVVGAVLAFPGVSQSQEVQAHIPLDVFEIKVDPTTNIGHVAGSDVIRHRAITTRWLTEHTHRSLLMHPRGSTPRAQTTLVRDRTMMTLGAAFGFFDAMQLSVALPTAVYQEGDDLDVVGFPGRTISGVALGDLRTSIKLQLLHRARLSGFGLAVRSTLYLPTGDDEAFLSAGSVRLQPTLIADWQHTAGIHLAVNLGYQLREKFQIHNVQNDDVIPWGLAGEWTFDESRWAVSVGLFGQMSTGEVFDPVDLASPGTIEHGNPAEVMIGVRHRWANQFEVGLGFGRGVVAGLGAPDFHGMFSLGWSNDQFTVSQRTVSPPARGPTWHREVQVDMPLPSFDGDWARAHRNRPAVSPKRLMSLETAHVGRAADVSTRARVGFSRNPSENGAFALPALQLETLTTVNVFHTTQIGVGLPMVIAASGDGFSLGRTRIDLKGLGRAGVGDKGSIALSVPVVLPETGTDQRNDVETGSRLHLDYRIGRTTLYLQPGIRVRDNREIDNSLAAVTDIGFGFSRQIGRTNWHLGGEVLALREISGFFDGQENDVFTLGVNARRVVTKGVSFGAFLSVDASGQTAISPSVGVTFGYANYEVDGDGDGIMDGRDKCPKTPEDRDGFQDKDGCPDGDNDGDGILDIQDKCPNAAEDKDGFADSDGCPDLDNDGDGVADDKDSCPAAAGRAVDSGCPDPDQDGIEGAADRCPKEPEDRDGFQDGDGCPELDNDGDRVPDADDRCPLQRGILQWAGCRDVVVRVYFANNSARIQKTSFERLDQMAEVLLTNPIIKGVRVEGHTDDRGSVVRNRKLSQGRAESVRRYLMDRGVDGQTIQAQGLGEDKPAVSIEGLTGAELSTARRQNRRVRFVLLLTEGTRD